MSQSNGTAAVGQRKIHPGAGRRAAPLYPKGRQSDETDLAAVRDLLGDRPRQRDFLIEYLHLIQDTEGCLRAGRLQALAEEMKLSMAEVYEVASFYAHFDIVLDGETGPAPVTVRSIAASRLPCRLPARLRLSSRLRRVGPSMLSAAPRAIWRGGLISGNRPFWVSST